MIFSFFGILFVYSNQNLCNTVNAVIFTLDVSLSPNGNTFRSNPFAACDEKATQSKRQQVIATFMWVSIVSISAYVTRVYDVCIYTIS